MADESWIDLPIQVEKGEGKSVELEGVRLTERSDETNWRRQEK